MILFKVLSGVCTSIRFGIIFCLTLWLGACATKVALNESSVTPQKNVNILIEEFMIPSDEPGIHLYVRNKRLATTTHFHKDNVLLFVHGATYPSETGFDLRLDGLS